MTIHELMYGLHYTPVLTALLILITLQMILIFASFSAGRSGKVRAAFILHCAVSYLLFYFPLNVFLWCVHFPNMEERIPAFLQRAETLPAAVICVYTAVSFVILAFAFAELNSFRKNHLTAGCIKETMDLLPAGIAFAGEDGTVLFANRTMQELSRKLTGTGMADLPSFKAAAEVCRTEKDRGTDTLALPDESGVWHIAEENMRIRDGLFTELYATDISKEAAIAEELEEKNIKLKDIQLRLKLYNRQADRIVISQELLNARMAVHSEVGNVLLECRHYLNNPDSFDEEQLLQALKNTNMYLLREYEQDDSAGDPLSDAMEMADAIGVDVTISGLIPQDSRMRAVLASAVNECASNTVKHAEGDKLKVTVAEMGDDVSFVLENNGKQPEESVEETGGLKSLRTVAENENGSMQIEVCPAFRVVIRLPKEKDGPVGT